MTNPLKCLLFPSKNPSFSLYPIIFPQKILFFQKIYTLLYASPIFYTSTCLPIFLKKLLFLVVIYIFLCTSRGISFYCKPTTSFITFLPTFSVLYRINNYYTESPFYFLLPLCIQFLYFVISFVVALVYIRLL